jgi:hypothetical protein
VLVVPIAPLASDGTACGHGEEGSVGGAFRDVANAYYVGGGTGLAECFKIDGRVTAIDDLAGRVEKAWAIKSMMQRTYEDHICVRGINARWVELGGDAKTRPETAWPREIAAFQAFSECVTMLDELLRLRMKSLANAGLPALERIVVGQRLGLLLSSPQLESLRTSAVGACPIEMRISTLRAAPAIGAAALAIEGWRRAGHLSSGGAVDVG